MNASPLRIRGPLAGVFWTSPFRMHEVRSGERVREIHRTLRPSPPVELVDRLNLAQKMLRSRSFKGRRSSSSRPAVFLSRVNRFHRLGLIAQADGDLPGLHRFGNSSDQIDLQQAVFIVGLLDFNMVFKIESPRKRSR